MLRALHEVFVDVDRLALGVDVLRCLLPRRTRRGFAGIQLAQHHDVGGDLGVRVALEGIVGESDCANEVGPLRQVFAQRRVLLVERAFGCDEQKQPARPHLLQRGGEEVIVDGKFENVEPRVKRLIVPKRNVGNCHVVEPVGQSGFLEWLVANVRIWIKRLRDAGGQQVNLDAGDGRVGVHLLRHQADEVTQPAGRLQNAPMPETETRERRVHPANDDRRRVVGVECRGAGGRVFLVRQKFG